MTDDTQFPFNKVGDKKSRVKSRSLREAAVLGGLDMAETASRMTEFGKTTPKHLARKGWRTPGGPAWQLVLWDQKSDLELGPSPLGLSSGGWYKNSPHLLGPWRALDESGCVNKRTQHVGNVF